MSSLAVSLQSSIGRKILVAATGLALLGFVIAHMLGNLQIFLGPDALNGYARSLKDLGPLLWVMRLGLLVVFVVHAVLAVRIAAENRAARPRRYVHAGRIQATTASRTMVVTGLMILLFVLYHLAHFTLGLTHPEHFAQEEIVPALGGEVARHDVYSMVVLGFQSPLVSGLYIAAMALLALHLSHAVASVFQTLGWNHPRRETLVRRAGAGLAWLIFLGNTSIPVAVLTGLVDLPTGA